MHTIPFHCGDVVHKYLPGTQYHQRISQEHTTWNPVAIVIAVYTNCFTVLMRLRRDQPPYPSHIFQTDPYMFFCMKDCGSPSYLFPALFFEKRKCKWMEIIQREVHMESISETTLSLIKDNVQPLNVFYAFYLELFANFLHLLFVFLLHFFFSCFR